MTPTWTDIAQAIGSIVSCGVTIIGFIFVYKQLKQVEQTIQKDSLESLYGRVHEIHQVILNDPQLRPFFYENRPLPDDEMLLNKVAVFSEMVLDFYELISHQKDFMPSDLFDSWETYIKDLYRRSPVLKDHLHKHSTWYSAEMRAFLTR